MKEKRCSICEEVKPIKEFHRQKSAHSGYKSACIPCRDVKRVKRIKDPRHVYLKLVERLKVLKRKKGTVRKVCSSDKFIKWYAKQDRVCTYCGLPENYINDLPFKENSGFVNKSRLEIDRKDNSKGYAVNNMVLACPICNRVKGSLLTEEDMLKVGKEIIKPKWVRLELKKQMEA